MRTLTRTDTLCRMPIFGPKQTCSKYYGMAIQTNVRVKGISLT